VRKRPTFLGTLLWALTVLALAYLVIQAFDPALLPGVSCARTCTVRQP
jgi:hypothetical protein